LGTGAGANRSDCGPLAGSASVSASPARRYSPEEQQVNEDAYDEALLEVEEALRPRP